MKVNHLKYITIDQKNQQIPAEKMISVRRKMVYNKRMRNALGMPIAGWWLIAAAVALGAILAAVMPPWQAPDEPSHFAYTQYLAEKHRLPVTLPKINWFHLAASQELAASLERSEFWDVHARRFVRQSFSGSAPAATPGLSRSYPDGPLQFPTAIHPPLYYAWLTVPYTLFRDQPVELRLLLMRIFSGLLIIPTLMAIFQFARRVLTDDRQALTVTALAGFQPMLLQAFFSVNSDAGVILFSSLTLWLVIRWESQMPRRKDFFAFGAVIGLGLLTKLHYLAVLPAAAVAVASAIRRLAPNQRWRRLAVFLTTLAIIAGGWFAWSWTQYGQLLPDVSGHPQDAQFRPLPLARTLTETTVFRTAQNFYSFWAAFGWRETTLPLTAYAAMLALTLLAVIGLVRWFRQRSSSAIAARGVFLGLTAIVALDGLLALLFVRNLWWFGSNAFPTHGRYFLPLTGVWMLLLTIGLTHLVTASRRNALCLGLTLAMPVYAVGCLLGLIVPRFYG